MKNGHVKACIKPFEQNKEVWIRLNLNSNYWEELEIKYPKIIKKYYRYNLNRISTLIAILEEIQMSYPKINSKETFPLTLTFSLRTDASKEVDLDIIDGDGETYPYLYEFSGQCMSIDHIIRLLIMCQMSYERKWWNWRLGLPEIHWIYAKLRNGSKEYRGESNEIIIYGEEIFVASPPETAKERILCIPFNQGKSDIQLDVFSSFVIKKCSCDYNFFVNRQDIYEQRLSEVINRELFSNNGEPRFARIYNVGQGNYVQINFTDEKTMVFDPGFEVSLDKDEKRDVITELGKIKPNIVMLSHWDSDHINGTAFSDKDIYKAVWIVPDIWNLCRSYFLNGEIGGISDFGFQILSYLIAHYPENLFMIDEGADKRKLIDSKNRYIRVWSGKRQRTSSNRKKNLPEYYTPYAISKQNNFGLILAIKNKKSILLPGDCDYKLMIPEICEGQYDYVMASHHCSKMGAFPFRHNNGTAILSYGENNQYDHPEELKIKEMEVAGYRDIHKTAKFTTAYRDYKLD